MKYSALSEAFDACVGAPVVTLLSAPAGFGKSMLLFAPPGIDMIGGMIKGSIDRMIQRLATRYLKNVILSVAKDLYHRKYETLTCTCPEGTVQVSVAANAPSHRPGVASGE